MFIGKIESFVEEEVVNGRRNEFDRFSTNMLGI